MKRIIKFAPVTLLLLLFGFDGIAQQFTISGQFRPRYELRNGYSTLMQEGNLPAQYISQRTRFGFGYTSEVFKVGLSVQNVGVWYNVA